MSKINFIASHNTEYGNSIDAVTSKMPTHFENERNCSKDSDYTDILEPSKWDILWEHLKTETGIII